MDVKWWSESSGPAIPATDCTTVLIGGEKREWTGATVPVVSAVRRESGDEIVLGKYAMCDSATALEALDAAVKAYDGGRGAWPRMKARERIAAVEKFARGMAERREEIVQLLMWSICKNRGDSEKEVDRTVQYIHETIVELKRMENSSNNVMNVQGVVAQIKRSPLGVALACGPYNYPLNELYVVVIPALLMGNTVVIKTPRTGGLCHVPLISVLGECFPAGVVNVVHGSGREVFTPIMSSGRVNILAFIGTHKAAQSLHTAHPHPFTVRLALGLDAKNPAFVSPSADLDVAASEVALGALSYCGQRCTAIKIVFVHESLADAFVAKLAAQVDAMSIGMPWDGAKITPLPEPGKCDYLRDLIADAEAKGARCVNNGKRFNHTLAAPTVLFPCSRDMRVTQEEQFGPVVPVLTYRSMADVEDYVTSTLFGQQASVFVENPADLPPFVDLLAHHVTRVNVNSQCQRGPDCCPFSGRKVSATGTLSIHDTLRTMSIRVAVATKISDTNVKIFSDVMRDGQSNVLHSDLLI